MSGIHTTVGEFLQKTRLERGISLEQIAQVTRVKLAYLQAIEQNEPSELPSVVQARGFLRLYANYLNLPAQPLLDGWQTGQFIIPEPAGQEIEAESLSQPQPEPGAEETTCGLSQPAEEIPEGEAFPEESAGEVETSVTAAVAVEAARSKQIFAEIGLELKNRREELSLSIPDVERFTRLRASYITALEDGQIEDLPSLVQGRGMLSNYAEFLDLDVEKLLLRFAEALQTRRIELTSPVTSSSKETFSKAGRKKPASQTPSWRRFLTMDLILGGGMFILLIGFVLWGAAQVTGMQREEQIPTPPSISEILMTPGGEVQSPTPGVSPTATPGQAVANTLAPGGGLEPQATEFTLPTLSSAPISVTIVASQRAWMRVTVDTSVVFEGRVSPGNAYPFTGRERIDLLTGNGAALSVIYNQTDLGSLGTMGEVVRISFTREGTSVPTPVFTATPTRTPQPTATLQPTEPQITPSITPLIP